MVFVASAAMALGQGSLFSFSVFLKPIAAEFGWARGETALAYTSATFLNGLFGIAMGMLADRYATRPIVLMGSVVLGGALVLLSRMDSLWQFYIYYGALMGGFALGAFLTPLVTNVGFWFERNRGVALGIVLAGQSLGGTLMPLYARWLLDNLGWRDAYLIMGLTAWAVVVPLALLIREAPGVEEAKVISRAAGAHPGARGIRPGVMAGVLGAAIVLCCINMSIPIVHLVALGTDKGISRENAATVLALMMFASIFGRVGIGKVSDWIGGMRALFLASSVQTLMIYGFPMAEGLPQLYVVALLFGVGYGGVIPAYAIIIREVMPMHLAGWAVGIVFFFGNVGMGIGGFLGGWLYDLSGSYNLSYATGAATGVMNLLIVGSLIWRYGRPQAPLQPVTDLA